jgi:uncharacterized membrane protein
MNGLPWKQQRSFLTQALWWLFFLICAFYSGYAFYMGGVELAALLGLVTDARPRAIPLLFVIHAFAGGMALLSGPLQFNRALFDRWRHLHRVLGRIYVWAIGVASLGGLGSAILFDVEITARILLGVLALLWLATTLIAFVRIRAGQVAAHRAWMMRSFALSFFFVTFSFWVPGLASTSLPQAISYPLAVFLSWSLNLLVAEIWVRRTAQTVSPKPASV